MIRSCLHKSVTTKTTDKNWSRLKANAIQKKVFSLGKGAMEVMAKDKNLCGKLTYFQRVVSPPLSLPRQHIAIEAKHQGTRAWIAFIIVHAEEGDSN